MVSQRESQCVPHRNRVSREYFFANYCYLIQKLADDHIRGPLRKTLEIGCGKDQVLTRLVPEWLLEGDVVQIDSDPEVIADAKKFRGKKPLLMDASRMPDIPPNSQDLIMMMSVLDQNLGLESTASEIRRVLAPEGKVLYVHNRGLNVPGAIYRGMRSENPVLVIPNPDVPFRLDHEFATAPINQIKQLSQKFQSRDASQVQDLRAYVDLPQPIRRRDLGGWKGLKVLEGYENHVDDERMTSLRDAIAVMRNDHCLEVNPFSSMEYIRQLAENLFVPKRGFRTLMSGVFRQSLIRSTHELPTNLQESKVIMRSAGWHDVSGDSVPVTEGATVLPAMKALGGSVQLIDDREPLRDETAFISQTFALCAERI